MLAIRKCGRTQMGAALCLPSQAHSSAAKEPACKAHNPPHWSRKDGVALDRSGGELFIQCVAPLGPICAALSTPRPGLPARV